MSKLFDLRSSCILPKIVCFQIKNKIFSSPIFGLQEQKLALQCSETPSEIHQ
jgi:hypothetical protein